MCSFKMTAIILSGGKCSRFGSDKAFIEIEGKPLIKRQVNFLKKIFENIIIVTNNPQKYEFRDIKIVCDVVKDRGPLAGIYSGLVNSDSFYNFVFSCDAPFLNADLIKYMISLKSGFDAVVPKLIKGYETLFAIYSKNCLLPISECLNANNLRVANFFAKIKLKELNEAEISQFGNPKVIFTNINTQDDLIKLRKLKGANLCQKQYQRR